MLLTTLTLVLACDPPSNDSFVESIPGDNHAMGKTPSGSFDIASQVHAELEAFLNDYAQAVYSHDIEHVGVLLSREVLSRLDSNNDGTEDESEIKWFVERQARMMRASLDGDVLDDPLVLERYQLTADQNVKVWLSHRGVELIKPHYVRLENGAWRYSVIEVQQERSIADYRVYNKASASGTVGCYTGHNAFIANKTSKKVPCDHYYAGCGIWYGTEFYHPHTYTCSYNYWGADFTMTYAGGYCTEDC